MGAVFFFTFMPVLLAVMGFIIVMAIAGIAVLVAGISGSIVSASVVSDKQIKATAFRFFGSLFLLGISCAAVLCGIFFEMGFLVAPSLVIIGCIVVALGIIGVVKAFSIESKAAKIIFVILLSLSTLLGSFVLAGGILVFVWGL